jgi:Respiratory-chain NADH dehydrogenase 51 Kd subunit.
MWSGTGVEESFLELFNDFAETLHESIQERSDDALEKMAKEEMIGIIKDRAIIGLGGSAFPTYIKLETKETIEHVV